MSIFKKFPFGLDISDYSIEVLELGRKFGKFNLKAYGRVKLEKGIVEDGKILNKEKLKEKIKKVLTKTQPRIIKQTQVILSLPEFKTFLHIFRLPAASHEDSVRPGGISERGLGRSKGRLRQVIKEEAKKIIPFNPGQIYFDFQVISKKKDVQEILYAGALREIVDEYLEVLKMAGLKPLVLDIESASLARAFKHEMVKDGAVLIVDIGARTTILTIFDKDSIRLSAIIPIAGNHFTQAISKKMDVSLKKAEELKKSCGLDPQKKEGKVMFILQGVLGDIFDKTKKFIGFYEEKSGRKIKKVLFCGGSSLMPKLTSDFSLNLGIEAKLADPFWGIKTGVKEKFLKINQARIHPILFSNVIGLAKRALEKDPEKAGINLIPLGKRPKPTFIGRKLSKSKIFSFLVIGATITAFVFLGWVVYTYILKCLFLKAPLTEAPLIEEELAPEKITSEEGVSPEEDLLLEEINLVIIEETETNWLRVREKPETIYSEIAKVYPGESYPPLEESEDWYKIELEDERYGWIAARYASKQ